VIGSAVVPTLIAQRFFHPALHRIEVTEEDEAGTPRPVTNGEMTPHAPGPMHSEEMSR
jgi:hypothetical protein